MTVNGKAAIVQVTESQTQLKGRALSRENNDALLLWLYNPSNKFQLAWTSPGQRKGWIFLDESHPGALMKAGLISLPVQPPLRNSRAVSSGVTCIQAKEPQDEEVTSGYLKAQ